MHTILEVEFPVVEKPVMKPVMDRGIRLLTSYGNKIAKTTYHIPSTTITKYDGGFNQGAFYGDLGKK